MSSVETRTSSDVVEVQQSGHQSVVAILDASKETDLSALRGLVEGLNLKPGSVFTLLGILQQVNTPSMSPFRIKLGSHALPPLLGNKIRADQNSHRGWAMDTLIEGDIRRKKDEIHENEDFVYICKWCEKKQIIFDMDVKPGHPYKVHAVEAVKELNPSLLILDRYVKDKKYFLDRIQCQIYRVRKNNAIETVRGPPNTSLGYGEMIPVLDYNWRNIDSKRQAPTPHVDAIKDVEKLQKDLQQVGVEDIIAMPKAQSMSDLSSHGSPESENASEADDSIQIDRSQSDFNLEKSSYIKQTEFTEKDGENLSTPIRKVLRKKVILSLKATRQNTNPTLLPIHEAESPLLTPSIVSKDATESTPSDVSSSSMFSKFTSGESSSSGFSECLICKFRSPIFGRELKAFTHSQLEEATENFSKANFLSEGGFGMVYKGRLKDGQYIAVKQHKQASAQGEKEFRSEVEVLSYAQHRNVVTLLGYCSEENYRLLVYEYVCKGSLDKHLHSKNPLPWHYRKKIAQGTARGLRYLHEEFRGGCIVHRDMRPNNILVTHDFEPRVGDFGLARSQKPCEADNETKVVGSFGYLAPEYAESGQVSTKTDVYSFGMVLLELITGRKALDRTLPGQSLLAWARPLLEDRRYHELIDPRLMDSHDVHELYCMVRAAGLCLRKDPASRPSMNQVVQILEGSMMNQLEEDSPLMSGGESSIQIEEKKDKKKNPVTYSEMVPGEEEMQSSY